MHDAVFKPDLTEETRTQLQEEEAIIASSCLILATPMITSIFSQKIHEHTLQKYGQCTLFA